MVDKCIAISSELCIVQVHVLVELHGNLSDLQNIKGLVNQEVVCVDKHLGRCMLQSTECEIELSTVPGLKCLIAKFCQGRGSYAQI